MTPQVAFPDKLTPHVLQRLEGLLVVGPLEGVEDGGADQQVGEGHHHQRQRPHVAPPHLEGGGTVRYGYFRSMHTSLEEHEEELKTCLSKPFHKRSTI